MNETAGKAIDALRDRPLVLALLLLNVIVFAAVYFTIEAARQQQHSELILILDKCLKG